MVLNTERALCSDESQLDGMDVQSMELDYNVAHELLRDLESSVFHYEDRLEHYELGCSLARVELLFPELFQLMDELELSFHD
jgi:hypothetical protein